MKKLLCIVIAVAMMMSLAACSSSNNQTEQPGSSNQTEQPGSNNQTEQPGDSASNAIRHDTVTVAYHKEPRSLIPYGSLDVGTSQHSSEVYDSLLALNSEGDLEPCLATSWEQIDDTHYRFKLREGVKFHNGNDFNADDVLYTYAQIAASDAISGTFGPVDVDNFVKEDDYTVVIALSEPYSAFLRVCAMDCCGIVDKETMEADPEGYKTHPIGTGPFKFVEWATGDYTKYEANKEWWGGDINFDNLVIRYITEVTTRSMEVESGGCDIARVDASVISTLQEGKGVVGRMQPTNNVTWLSFNCAAAPFDNVKVRQAVSLAIDCQKIADTATYGMQNVGRSPISSAMKSSHYDAQSEYAEYNVEKAKSLLAEAGYPDGLKVSLVCDGDKTEAEMIQSYLKAIGIEVELNVTDFSNWLDCILNGRQQMFIGGWTVDTGDPSEFFVIFDSRCFSAGGNRAYYSNPEVDALIDKVMVETNEEQRYEYCKQIQEIIAEECVTVNLYEAAAYYEYSDSIENFITLPSQGFIVENITFTK